jgi:hypothetical protein
MAAGDIQSRNGLQDISNILNIFKGSGTTTQTDTSSEVVSNDKAKAIIQNILEGTSGLAAVSSGQKQAGLYGSTVNTQLTNDLLARAAAQTSALSSQKTNTSTRQTGPQLDPIKTLLGLAAGQVVTPIVKAGSKKLGLDKFGNTIADSIFGDSPVSAFAGDTTPASISNFAPSVNIPVDFGSISDLKDLSSSLSSGDVGDTGAAGGMDVGTAAALGVGAGTGAALAGSSAAGGAALTDASYAVMGGEAFGASAFGGAAAGATAAEGAGAVAAGATAAETGAAIAEGATAAEGAGVLSELGTAAVALWIICTELNKQGRLPYRYYIYGAREFAKYDERGKQGYYIWAIPSVRHLRKHPNSYYSKLLEVVFNARAEYLAAKAGCKGAKKTTLGFLTTHGLYGFCWILSRTIARKSYSKEQILNVGA